MILILLLVLSGTPDWAITAPCCGRTVCTEPKCYPINYQNGRPDGGPVCVRTAMSCTGDLVCHACSTSCLLQYISLDGGIDCADDSRRMPDGGFEHPTIKPYQPRGCNPGDYVNGSDGGIGCSKYAGPESEYERWWIGAQ
jgi:hypothetical protein